MPVNIDADCEWEKAIAAFEADLKHDVSQLFQRFRRHQGVAACLRAICDRQVQEAGARSSAAYGQHLFDELQNSVSGSLGKRKAEYHQDIERIGGWNPSQPTEYHNLPRRTEQLEIVRDDDQLPEVAVNMMRWIRDEVQCTDHIDDVNPEPPEAKRPCRARQSKDVGDDARKKRTFSRHKGCEHVARSSPSTKSRDEHGENTPDCSCAPQHHRV